MDILQRLLIKPYPGSGDNPGGRGGGGDDGNVFVGLVAVAAIVAALSGNVGIAVAIVLGAIAIYFALFLLGWILGGILYGIAAAIINPFALLGRLLTGRRPNSNPDETESDPDAPPDTHDTPSRGWLYSIARTVLITTCAFFLILFLIGVQSGTF